jgi:Tfp pilus assembly protein PilZ
MLLPAQDDDAGQLCIPTRERVGVGQAVRVEVSFGALADEVVLAGTVARIWPHREDGTPRIVVRVSAEHADRVRYVEEIVQGERAAAARAHHRVKADLRVRWRWAHGEHRSRLADISRGGAFVVSDRLPELGSPLEIEIDVDETLPLGVEGVVSWLRPRGERSGFGVMFKVPDRSVAARLSDVVRRLEA